MEKLEARSSPRIEIHLENVSQLKRSELRYLPGEIIVSDRSSRVAIDPLEGLLSEGSLRAVRPYGDCQELLSTRSNMKRQGDTPPNPVIAAPMCANIGDRALLRSRLTAR